MPVKIQVIKIAVAFLHFHYHVGVRFHIARREFAGLPLARHESLQIDVAKLGCLANRSRAPPPPPPPPPHGRLSYCQRAALRAD